MKKIISLILALIMLVSFAACGKQEEQGSVQQQTTTSQQPTTAAKIDKNRLKTVKFKIPVEAIEPKYQNDLDAFCQANGYESAKLNKRKGIVTIKVNELSYKLMLTRTGMTVIKGLYNLLESKTYKYFKDIEGYDDKNFSEVTILVNEKSYKNDSTSTLLPFTIAQTCFVYQMYTEKGITGCNVVIKNAKTKQVIETKTYTEKDA